MLEITNKYPERKKQLTRPRHGWEDMWLDITEIGCEGTDLIHFSSLCQHRNKPSGSMKAEVAGQLSNDWLLLEDYDPKSQSFL
jgi:hypothetical protein